MVPPILIAERRVARQFLRANAVRPADAIPFSTDRFIYQRAFDLMRNAGVFRGASGGSWYLDPPAYEEYRVERRRRALTLAGLAMLGGVMVAYSAGIFTALH